MTSIETLDSLRITLDPIGQAFIASALFLIMLGVSLGLRLQDFAFIKSAPKLFLGGVITQLLGLPLLTLVLILIFAPPPSIALGMLVVASCPGGTVSNMLVYFARGDLAFSVALTATSSLFAAFFTPASILIWSSFYRPTANLLETIDYSPIAFIAQTAALLAVPLLLGMTLNAKFPQWARLWRSRIANLGAMSLLAAVIFGTIQFFPTLMGALHLLVPMTVIQNGAAFILGASVARALGAEKAKRRTLTFEIGIQNSGLALVILLGQLNGVGGAIAIAAIWGIWHLIAGGAIVSIFRFIDAKGTHS